MRRGLFISGGRARSTGSSPPETADMLTSHPNSMASYPSIELQNPCCPWARAEDGEGAAASITVWVRGQAWFEGAFLDARQLAARLCALLRDPAAAPTVVCRRILSALNGHFALVVRTPHETVAAVDRSRTIPLFYGTAGQRILLSDEARRVRAFVADQHMDPDAVTEFLLTGYVTGRDTLYATVKQVRPGEIIRIRDGAPASVEREHYCRFLHTDARDEPDEMLCQAMSSLFERVFDRFRQSLQGRRIVVPLSGGFDSRLIVAGLKQAGVRDVVCFTYGRPGNDDSALSQQVARQLGYEWHFVPYTRETWRTWFRSEAGCAYRHYATNLCSLTHLQEAPALQALRAKGVLQPGDEIAPGHTPLGGYIPPHWAALRGDDDVMREILRFHYSCWRWWPGASGLGNRLEQRILTSLAIAAAQNAIEVSSHIELWEIDERHAKFILNCLRAYEFHGCGWRLPICDNDVWEFDIALPLRCREGRRLYQHYLRTVLFPRMGLADIRTRDPHRPFRVKRERIPAPLLTLCRDLRRIWLLSPDPRLGSFTLPEVLDTWRTYRRHFGHGVNSLERLVEINTLAAVDALREMRQEAL